MTSSGLFLLIAKTHLFFYIGTEYYEFFVPELTDKTSQLISEELLIKLDRLYDAQTNPDTVADDGIDLGESKQSKQGDSKKITFCAEGSETAAWKDYIEGEKVEDFSHRKRKQANTMAKRIKMQRTMAFNAMNMDRDNDSYGEESESDEDDSLEMIPFDNELTRKLWLP